ncbi:MAG: hypothetical protein RLY17_1335, partial [Pseudomonadota bacterium]
KVLQHNNHSLTKDTISIDVKKTAPIQGPLGYLAVLAKPISFSLSG